MGLRHASSSEGGERFTDYAYWNELHLEEEPFVVDPDGQLAKWKRGMDSLLVSEAAKGNHPSVVPLKARRRNYIPVMVGG